MSVPNLIEIWVAALPLLLFFLFALYLVCKLVKKVYTFFYYWGIASETDKQGYLVLYSSAAVSERKNIAYVMHLRMRLCWWLPKIPMDAEGMRNRLDFLISGGANATYP